MGVVESESAQRRPAGFTSEKDRLYLDNIHLTMWHIDPRKVAGTGDGWGVLIGISTSGNSRNVSLALEAGRKSGATTIGLLGRDGGEIGPLVDLALTVPETATPRVQEAHLLIIHILCEQLEKRLFQKDIHSSSDGSEAL